MTGSIAPNRPGHHGTVVARTVGTVAISCNATFSDVNAVLRTENFNSPFAPDEIFWSKKICETKNQIGLALHVKKHSPTALNGLL